jgi:hypothetical protein
MIDTKSFLEHEVDFLLDSLDFYEKIKFMDDVEYSRMREMAEIIEGQIKRQIKFEEENNNEDIKENASVILNGITNYKKEVLQKEKQALISKRINKEKITLLKAKLILLQQENAAESIFKNLEPNE